MPHEGKTLQKNKPFLFFLKQKAPIEGEALQKERVFYFVKTTKSIFEDQKFPLRTKPSKRLFTYILAKLIIFKQIDHLSA